MTQQESQSHIIIEAALPLFAEKGYAATSMNAIAKAAGMSKANLFHHFGSKQELYISVLKAACQSSAGLLNEAAKGHIDLSFKNLAPFLQQELQEILDQPEITLLVMREVIEGEAGIEQSLAQEVFAEHFQLLIKMVEDGINQGILKADPPAELVAFTLISMNLQYFQSHTILRHLSQSEFAHNPAVFLSILSLCYLPIISLPANAETQANTSPQHTIRAFPVTVTQPIIAPIEVSEQAMGSLVAKQAPTLKAQASGEVVWVRCRGCGKTRNCISTT